MASLSITIRVVVDDGEEATFSDHLSDLTGAPETIQLANMLGRAISAIDPFLISNDADRGQVFLSELVCSADVDWLEYP